MAVVFWLMGCQFILYLFWCVWFEMAYKTNKIRGENH